MDDPLTDGSLTDDSLTDDPLTRVWRPDQVAVMEALRDWALAFTELNHHLAAWMDLPTSDANALGQVVWAAESGTPLSPAQLARRLGMTTGATTLLLDRLERAGFVGRTRESSDRRRVTVRPTDVGREQARGFIAHAGAEIAATVGGADPEDLRRVTGFVTDLTAASVAAAGRLHDHRRTRTPRQHGDSVPP